MKMYGSLSDEDLNEWERLPSVMRVLCSAQMGAWLLRRDENKEKSEHKTGRWIDNHTTCSECNWSMYDDITESRLIVGFNYCPNCGAKMEVEE